MHDQYGALADLRFQHLIGRESRGDIGDIEEHGELHVTMKPVSYTLGNSFADIIVF